MRMLLRAIGWIGFRFVACALIAVALLTGCGRQRGGAGALDAPDDGVARIVFFSAADCEPCQAVYRSVVEPLLARCGSSLEVKLVDIATSEGHEAFVATETALIGEAGRWDVPAIVVENTDLVGESAIRQELVPRLECVLGAGGNGWTAVAALEAIEPVPQQTSAEDGASFGVSAGESAASCLTDEASAVCESSDPMFVLYVTPTECAGDCDRTRYDLRYLQGVFPQMVFEVRTAAESLELLPAVGELLGVPVEDRTLTPVVFVGDDYLLGDDVTLEHLRQILSKYAESGAAAFWYTLDLSD